MHTSLMRTLVLAGHSPDRRLLARIWDDAVEVEDWASAAAVAAATGLPEQLRARIGACDNAAVRAAHVKNPDVSFHDATQLCRTETRSGVLDALKSRVVGPDSRAQYVDLLLDLALTNPGRSEQLCTVFADVNDTDLAGIPVSKAWPILDLAASGYTSSGRLDFNVLTGEYGGRARPGPDRPPAAWLLKLRGRYVSAALRHPGIHRAWPVSDPAGPTLHAGLLCAAGRTAAQVDADVDAWLDMASSTEPGETSRAYLGAVMVEALAFVGAGTEENRRVMTMMAAVCDVHGEGPARVPIHIMGQPRQSVADTAGFTGQTSTRLLPDPAADDPLPGLLADTFGRPGRIQLPDTGFLLVRGGHWTAPSALSRAVTGALSREDDVARLGWECAARLRTGPINADILRLGASRFRHDPVTLAAIICCADAELGFELLPAAAKTEAAYLLLDDSEANLVAPAVIRHLLTMASYADLPWSTAYAMLRSKTSVAQRGWTGADASELADWFGTEIENCHDARAAWTVVEKLADSFCGSVGSLLTTVGELLNMTWTTYPRVPSRSETPVRLVHVNLESSWTG